MMPNSRFLAGNAEEWQTFFALLWCLSARQNYSGQPGGGKIMEAEEIADAILRKNLAGSVLKTRNIGPPKVFEKNFERNVEADLREMECDL